ncbi:adenylosuccinate lyase family protein [Pendulispora albinea]|uniref:Adenylosuccinate lyase family protein n=1 Tax=Pendulispora albinea TaxID=2741071 RepID=A0ABZ2M2Z0_9BACT
MNASIHPADSAIFGTLFGTDAMRAIFAERALFARMLDVEAALARCQGRLGIIPAEAADAISRAANLDCLDALDALDAKELATSVQHVGYPVVAVVRALSRAAGEDAGRWTHWGATTQDILDTAVVLQIRDGLARVRQTLIETIGALARQADRHRATTMVGRTHLQQAAPISFGLKCAVWLAPLVAHVERLDQLRPRVERVELGGAAGTLASLGDRGTAVMDALAAELGLASPPVPWHVARDGFAEAVAFLGLLCGSLAKIATDVILLGQTEVGELFEPYEDGRGGSSTMPQKRNPIASEYVIAAARAVHALVPLMQGAMVQDHERASGPWQSEALALPQAFVLAHGALEHTRRIVEGMQPDPARMLRNTGAGGGLLMAEAVMMELAPRVGRSAAHHLVQEVCKRAESERIDLAEALRRTPETRAQLDDAAIARATDPSRYLGSAGTFIDRVLAQAHALRMA